MLKTARVLALVAVVVGFLVGIILSYAPTSEASRNAGGTYSLPSGNPVVTNTTITSSWANTTLADLANEMTNSLERNGKGPMLAPLRLTNGSISAPSLTFDSDANTGIYRITADTIGTAVAGVLAESCDAGGCTFPRGVTVTQANLNTDALVVTGNGTGRGVYATGGTGAAGGSFIGGAGNNYGALGEGTGNASGGSFLGGPTNGVGVEGFGRGTGVGGYFANGTAATGGTRQNAVLLTNGDLSFSGVAAPTKTTSISNALTPTNMIKAWGNLTTNGASPTINDGFNITSASCAAQNITVTIGGDMATANYAVVASMDGAAGRRLIQPQTLAAGTFVLTASDVATPTAVDLCAGTANVYFMVVGAQ